MKFNKTLVYELLQQLNEELAKKNILGEIIMCGGSALCAAYDLRQSTHDIDAVMIPATEIRDAVRRVANKYENVPHDWLNDAVKGFFFDHNPPTNKLYEFSNLRVDVVTLEYLLAMKVASARTENNTDIDDIERIARQLGLENAPDIYAVANKYADLRCLPIRSKYMLIERFGDPKHQLDIFE